MRRPAGLVSLIVSVALLTCGWWVYDSSVGVWGRLRSSADRIHPRGFEVRSSVEKGTTFCFISCDEARIDKVLGSKRPDQIAECRRLVRSLETLFGQKARDPRGDSDPGCSVVPLPGVHDGAYANVMSIGGECPVPEDFSCFRVIVNSGID